MSGHPRTSVVLVAPPAIRQARLWTACPTLHVRSYGFNEFDAARHLAGGIPVLIYQVHGNQAAALRLLKGLSITHPDLCIILLGPDIGADRVAALLRHGAYDYLTWPCSIGRLRESIAQGLRTRRLFLEVQHLSDELARTNLTLAKERDELARCNGTLSGLHDLTQSLAASLDPQAVATALFAGLPPLVGADAIALARTNPDFIWSWSRTGDPVQERRAREQVLRSLHQSNGALCRPAFPSSLRLVPPVDAEPSLSDHETIAIHLALGSHSTGCLRVEKAVPFTAHEGQVLGTLATSVALSLRNADSHRRLQDLALQDPLTGTLNRRALEEPLTREFKAKRRYGAPGCLILLDLDYFKTVNDVLGHPAGDEVLRQVAALLKHTVRDIDSLARYGGEEFAVVLPHTALAQAVRLADRIRAAVENHPFTLHDGQVRLTASLGVAALQHDMPSTGDWIGAADSALYRAKTEGRNRVATHDPTTAAPATAALCVAA